MTAGNLSREPSTIVAPMSIGGVGSSSRGNLRRRRRPHQRSTSTQLKQKRSNKEGKDFCAEEEMVIQSSRNVHLELLERRWSSPSQVEEHLSSSSDEEKWPGIRRISSLPCVTAAKEIPTISILRPPRRSSSLGIIRRDSNSNEENNSGNGSVKWSTSPVSSTREYPPLTKSEEKHSLFYNSQDYERFREEYKVVLRAKAFAHLSKQSNVIHDAPSSSSGCASCLLNMILPKSLAGIFQTVSTSVQNLRQNNVVSEEDFNPSNLLVDTMYLF